MEAVRLFLLKIILSAIVLNLIIAKNTAAYNTISTNDRKHQEKSIHRRNWSSKSSSAEAFKYMPPYLVFNRKVGAYYPYFKYPGDNNLRRMDTHKARQWKG